MLLKYKNAISEYLNGRSNIFFHWKGRISLYAILKAMDIKTGDEIILPAFTCVVVPNAIMYLGAKPVYVDIDQNTYNLDLNLLENAITKNTRVIICQNTFGLSSNLEEINSIAKKHNLYTIEDCTHGFGGKYAGNYNGLNCDAAFFSTQWNKPFSTGLGGFALINNSLLLESMKKLEKHKIKPSAKEVTVLKLLYFVKRFLIKPKTYWTMIKCYRWLSKNNLIVGSSSGGEISTTEKPQNFFKDFSMVQTKEGLKNIAGLERIMDLRKKNANIYSIALKKMGKNHVDSKLFANHAFLKYPLLVNNRDQFLHLAEIAKIPLGDWFISPLHPVISNLHKWNFDENLYPVAVEVSKKMINLPTDTENPQKIIDFLIKNQDYIENANFLQK